MTLARLLGILAVAAAAAVLQTDLAADPVADNIQKAPVVGKGFEVHEMSTSLTCVISLTCQYFIVYTALAVAGTAADAWGVNYGNFQLVEVLQQAAITVNYAPMMACLFLAFRMRVNWLTRNQGNPPVASQVWMIATTYALLAMTLVSICVPIFTGEIVQVDPETGDIPHEHQPFKNTIVAVCFTVLKYVIMATLYFGIACILYGIIMYEPPRGSWPNDVAPPPSPAVACTMILTCMYFTAYIFIQVCKTYTSFAGVSSSKITGAIQGAVCSMAFAPMLSVLFIGARMRALQMDPIHGHPQKWAQNCFYVCTYAVMLQCICAVAVPLVMGGKVQRGNKGEGDVEYEVDHAALGTGLTIMRYIIMACVYVGFTCVIVSVFTIEHPNGPEFTPPISVTMQCVINLTVQYFTVYLLIWICITVKDFTGWDWHIIANAMKNAEATVSFCPMLAILFVGTRMRALRMTDNRGAPQGWVQDGMYMATWAVLIQFFMVMLIPVASYLMSGGKHVEHPRMDVHGSAHWEPKKEHTGGKVLMLVVQIIRWLGFVLLYAGVITVMVGAITMTPETANGRGALPLVRQTPVGQEPKGANDIPGMPTHGGKATDGTTAFMFQMMDGGDSLPA